jgi:hypothetical protein
VYDERFAAFLEIHKRLRGLYRRLNRDAPPAPPAPAAAPHGTAHVASAPDAAGERRP